MKTFDQYSDGDWVVYINPKSPWHLMQFQAYKSQYTHNAFRLKFGAREVVADISEVEELKQMNNVLQEDIYARSNSNLQSDSERSGRANQDADWDFDRLQGIYGLQD